MSAIRYFKKTYPKQGVLLSNGTWLKFSEVDYETGIFGATDEKLLAEVDKAIAAHRGGITEVSVEEFQELLKKKEQPNLRRQWREEYSKEGIMVSALTAHSQVPVPLEIVPGVPVAVPVDTSKPVVFEAPVASRKK